MLLAHVELGQTEYSTGYCCFLHQQPSNFAVTFASLRSFKGMDDCVFALAVHKAPIIPSVNQTNPVFHNMQCTIRIVYIKGFSFA